MGRGETEVSDSEGVRREKQREERKSEKAYHKRERRPHKIMFPIAIDEDNIYIRYNV